MNETLSDKCDITKNKNQFVKRSDTSSPERKERTKVCCHRDGSALDVCVCVLLEKPNRTRESTNPFHGETRPANPESPG